MDKIYRILVINPGSTSTKLSMFENETCLFTEDVFHDSSVLKKFPTINDQLDYRMEVVDKFLKDGNIDLTGVDAIVGRGGGCYSVEGGIYKIDDRLIQDTKAAKGGLYHSSMLGVQMADVLHKKYGGIMIMMNPPIVDELCDLARVTGVDGVYRRAVCHALNLKETARRQALSLGKKYEDCNFLIVHMGGGITVGAHKKGKVIDNTNGLDGEGPFSPERSGGLPVGALFRACYGDEMTKDQVSKRIKGQGGVVAYLGTNDIREVEARINDGDEKAKLVYEAMIYQICKEIGAYATVLKGDIDAIILTGGIAHSAKVRDMIKERVGFLGEVLSYPGEDEMSALAEGGLRVLKGEEEALVY